MEIYLKQGKKKFRFAVLPQEYEITSESNNTQVNINGCGEINLLGKRKLKTVSFSSFFPKREESYCEYASFPSPKASVKKIEKMKKKGVMRLTMTGTPVNMDCTIESFVWGENDGSKDINFTLEFREYRKIKAKKKKKKEKLTAKVEPADGCRLCREVENGAYFVRQGDDIQGIAKKLTGRSANWKAIYLMNREVIGVNPASLIPGQRLVVKVED